MTLTFHLVDNCTLSPLGPLRVQILEHELEVDPEAVREEELDSAGVHQLQPEPLGDVLCVLLVCAEQTMSRAVRCSVQYSEKVPSTALMPYLLF